jgi:hypothetical protein
VSCIYAPTNRGKPIITLDQGKHKTSASFNCRQKVPIPRRQELLPPRPRGALVSSADTARHLYYFDVFVQRNTFNTGTVDYSVDVKQLLGTEPGNFLTNAVVAVGALQSYMLSPKGPASRQQDSYAALQAYAASLVSLRDTMAQSFRPSPLHITWTTMFLGLFEVSRPIESSPALPFPPFLYRIDYQPEILTHIAYARRDRRWLAAAYGAWNR